LRLRALTPHWHGGANARRLYKVQAPANIIRKRVTEIERPDWWPTDEEVHGRGAPRGGGRGRRKPVAGNTIRSLCFVS
jgi:hypothetical protein